MTATTMVTRPDLRHVVFVLLLAALGGGGIWLTMQPSCGCPQGTPYFTPGPLLFTALAVSGSPILFWLFANRIAWDDAGVQYRTRRGACRVDWSAVLDYGICFPPQGRIPQYMLFLADGTALRVTHWWQNGEAFRDAVQAKATHARVREWDTIGLRAADTDPQIFTYDARRAAWLAVLFPLTYFLMLSPLLVPSFIALIHQDHSAGWQWEMAAYLTVLIAFGGIPVGMAFVASPMFRDTARRGKESLTLTLDGIQFTDGTRLQSATWNDVSDYYVEKPAYYSGRLYAVRIGDTNTVFRFTSRISDVAQLKRIIERRSGLANQPWRNIVSEEPDNGPVAPWQEGDAVRRVYHYRTRLNRTMLLGGAAMLTVLLFGIYAKSLIAPEELSKTRTFLPFSALIGIVLAVHWRGYLVGRIETDNSGITKYTLFSQQYLPWMEVTEWVDCVQSLTLKTTSGRCLSVDMTITDSNILKDEIQKRTGLASVEE